MCLAFVDKHTHIMTHVNNAYDHERYMCYYILGIVGVNLKEMWWWLCVGGVWVGGGGDVW